MSGDPSVLPSTGGGPNRVQLLVVDDEEEIRNMLMRHFKFHGFLVDTAGNGHEALKVLNDKKVHIIISDINMPGMNGIDLLRTTKREYPMIHSIMITGYVTMENALACMRLGADTLIFKPITDLGALEQAVEQAVDRIRHWINLLRELQAMKPAG